MTAHRVTAPEPPADGSKSKGPASYFPSIEKTYGRPVQEWLDLVADRLDTERHMEVVTWLKTEHGMGHGHANAVVGYVKNALAARDQERDARC
ncbi:MULTISPECIES: DUF4287 domain-containing protein [unclassified Curtobacterium]|uniref:DUF4287 domain-containing protein n=1 Tax=unclassified Curtobacterium TaxID=257496 RepID=UPI0037F3A646